MRDPRAITFAALGLLVVAGIASLPLEGVPEAIAMVACHTVVRRSRSRHKASYGGFGWWNDMDDPPR